MERGQPQTLRLHNRRAVVQQLALAGLSSRALLARDLMLSPVTIGKVVADLLQEGILEQVSSNEADSAAGNLAKPVGEVTFDEESRPGRPSQWVRLQTNKPLLLAIQIGVRTTRLALMGAAVADDVWQASFATGAKPATWWKRLNEKTAESPFAEAINGSLRGIVVSLPGIVDETNSKVIHCPNLHWLAGSQIMAELQSRFGLRTVGVQEIRALAMGHARAVPEADDFLLVDFGEGVGAAAVQHRRIMATPSPVHGEIGHTPIPGNDRACGCGMVGCVETLLSREGLLATASQAMGRNFHWRELRKMLDECDGLPGWLKPSLEQMGIVIASALNLTGLKHVVITGSLNELPAFVTEALCNTIVDKSMLSRFSSVTCGSASRRRLMGLSQAGLDRVLLAESALATGEAV